VDVCGLEYLLVQHAHPGVPQRLILRSLELFATKVMPAFADGTGATSGAPGTSPSGR
jgi:hypothetical protein